MALWEYHLTDLAGISYGEITTADERKLTLSHLRMGTASATVRMDDPRARDAINNDCLLKVYRQQSLGATKKVVFNGPVTTVEENADETAQTVAITAASPLWRLTKRLIPASLIVDSTTGKGTGWSQPNQDLGLTAHQMLQSVNSTSFTGISVGTRTSALVGSYGPVYAKNAAQSLAEMSTGVGSFEFEFAATEPTNVGQAWPQIALMNVAPTIGTSRLDAIFEWGTARANVTSYKRVVDRDGMLTRAWMPVSGWPDAPESGHTLLGVDASGGAITSRGLFEDMLDDAGIIDDALRTAVMNYHLTVRKAPRQILTFKPAVNSTPSIFNDYYVGDSVRCRAEQRGTVYFDGTFRIWGATVNLDTNGNENVELELVMP
jgi:hypothetical protein